MRAAQIVPTWPNLMDRIHRLHAFAHINAFGHLVQRTKLIGIHDKLLKVSHKAAFKPAARVQHEVHP